MDERLLIPLGILGFLLFASSGGNANAASGGSAPVESDPADPSEASAGATNPAGMGALDSYSPSRWYQLSNFVQIYIPFQQRSVNTGGGVGCGSAKVQFLYNGRWYDGQNLLKVWNPIRQLPSYLR